MKLFKGISAGILSLGLAGCGSPDPKAQAINACSEFVQTVGLDFSNTKGLCECYVDSNETKLNNPEEFDVMLSIMAGKKTMAAYTELLGNAHTEGRISMAPVSLNATIFECDTN